eukprot:COSAG04_NODE_3020_length_3270_cov_2.515295_4_plen_203_part_00
MAAAKANGSDIVVFPESAIGSCPGPDTDDEGWTRDSILPYLEPVPTPTSPPTVLCDLGPAARAAAPVSTELSCLARQHRIAAVFGAPDRLRASFLAGLRYPRRCRCVADLGDVQPCSGGAGGGGGVPVKGGCRADGRAQFNTAVAFDSDGALLEKYHKHHLFKEQAWFRRRRRPDAEGPLRASRLGGQVRAVHLLRHRVRAQ